MTKQKQSDKVKFSLSELNRKMTKGEVMSSDELRFYSRAIGALHDRLLKFFGVDMFKSLRWTLGSEQRMANTYLLHRSEKTVDVHNLSDEDLGYDFSLVEKMPTVTHSTELSLRSKDVSNIERRLVVILERLKDLNHEQRSSDVDVVEHVYLKWVQEFKARRKLEKNYKESES